MSSAGISEESTAEDAGGCWESDLEVGARTKENVAGGEVRERVDVGEEGAEEGVCGVRSLGSRRDALTALFVPGADEARAFPVLETNTSLVRCRGIV